MLHVVLPAFVVGFSVLFHFLVSHVKPYKERKEIHDVGKVLLVIAHPDDECMFFGPTVVQLVQKGCEVHLLCLTSGNYYSHGRVRKRELRNSCNVLGIEPSFVTVIEHTKLPDNPKNRWREDLVGSIILKHVLERDIDTIITFDNGGVSGHRNHVALYYGMSYLCKEGLLPTGCRVFTLDSINILRKYIGLLDVPWSYCRSKYAYILSQKDIAIPQRAMFAHASQMLWYRWLYIYLSRYMVINTFEPLMLPSDKPSDESTDSEHDKLD